MQLNAEKIFRQQANNVALWNHNILLYIGIGALKRIYNNFGTDTVDIISSIDLS